MHKHTLSIMRVLVIATRVKCNPVDKEHVAECSVAGTDRMEMLDAEEATRMLATLEIDHLGLAGNCCSARRDCVCC
jgi:hypothetical protein